MFFTSRKKRLQLRCPVISGPPRIKSRRVLTNDCIIEESCAKSDDVSRSDESEIPSHMDSVVSRAAEKTLNGLLETESEQFCRAERDKRSDDRADTRSSHYKERLGTRGRVDDAPRPARNAQVA